MVSQSETPEEFDEDGLRKALAERLGKLDDMEEIGRGTFGVSFRVSQSGRTWAVKIIKSLPMQEFRWQRELAALQAIDHPNVVRYLGAGGFDLDGATYYYLEMEFVAGGNLKSRLRDGLRPSEPDELQALARGLLRGVSSMHGALVTHRDIKPANVCMRDASWGEPVIVDLGLAKLDSMETYTQYPARVGTLPYMAPEQLRGQRARQRSDLFAVGVAVYHVGTGVHPFQIESCGSFEELHARIRTGPRDPRQLSGAFDDATAAVVMRALSYREPDRRTVALALANLGEDDR